MRDAPGLRNWLKLVCLGLIWGASFMAVSVALRDFGPLTIVALRVTMAASSLLVILRLLGVALPDPRKSQGRLVWGFAILMGLFSNAMPFTLLSWGQTYVASGFAGVCMAAVPLFVLPMAHLLVPGEHLTLRRSLGFAIGFVGVLVLIGLDAFDALGSDFESLARLACLGAALCYATGSIVTRLCPDTNMLALSAAAMLCAALMIVPIALWNEGLPQRASALSVAAILYLGVLPTAVAQVLVIQVIRDAGPSFMSLVNYQVPVWSAVIGAAILGEPLPPSLWLALVLILSGLGLSQLGTMRRLFGRS
ncbi:DMT family transporter [Shimia sp.]|uniref:DMT family transporter n=1 Tax=Shimia sp. TaxID=1954381 RepID=UPI0035631299